LQIVSNSTTKKVYIRRLDHQLLAGYVTPQTYLRAEGVEVIDRGAEVTVIPYEQVKAIYFVREFEGDPEADKKVFASRPKLDGLWIRLTFRGGELMEGVLPNNLLLMSEHGLMLTPPEANSNTHRVFVPRAALEDLKVLGVIGSPVHTGRRRGREPSKEQMDLFEQGTAVSERKP
jgi:Family of unknown function (DUF6982)